MNSGELSMRMIYFVRHGETIANEQNYFAGKMDVPLTELGIHQAQQAGNYMRKHGLVFDEVHTSTLSRAQETANIMLDQAGHDKIPIHISEQLIERDFGEFTESNKNLLRKTNGFANYEELLHSHEQCPLTAESFQELYDRVADYYNRVLSPRADNGKKILVVSHKYVIEMLAMILNKTPIDEYFDLRLPNARPMSENEVAGYFKGESKWLKNLSDMTLYSSSIAIVVAFIVGAFGKLLIQDSLASWFFMGMVGTLVSICAFFVMLMVNTRVLKQSFQLDSRVLFPWAGRLGISAILWIFWPHEPTRSIWLLLLMPPAITSPVASLLWGGTLHLATRITVFFTLLAPLYLGILFQFSGKFNLNELVPFIILSGAMLIPSIFAQSIRVRFPIQAGKIAERWKWLGVVSVMVIALICGYRFTPSDLIEIMQSGDDRLRLMMTQGGFLLVVFIFLKTFSHIVKGFYSLNANEEVDVYVTHATPNIFLWISLISGVMPSGYIGFWGAVFFFFGMFLDECHFVQDFSNWFRVRHERLLAQEGLYPSSAGASLEINNNVFAREPLLEAVKDSV
ncbi:MAG: hypothetical protein GY705_30920 [Bacteroidetes bacterium]|nr:hypothetical protein [Bacteroidota bacterium]